MEYNPNDFSILEDYKNKRDEEEYAKVIYERQRSLSEINPSFDYIQMKYIITLRDATRYYEYNGSIYGNRCGQWRLETTEADKWIKEMESIHKKITPEEAERRKKESEQMLQESYARLSGNEISQTELDLYKPKPLGKASIWFRIKRKIDYIRNYFDTSIYP
jgi:hypothetical protein